MTAGGVRHYPRHDLSGRSATSKELNRNISRARGPDGGGGHVEDFEPPNGRAAPPANFRIANSEHERPPPRPVNPTSLVIIG